MVVSTALEAVPRKARGLVSGSVGEAFAVGSILASGLSLAMGNTPLSPRKAPSIYLYTTNTRQLANTDGAPSTSSLPAS